MSNKKVSLKEKIRRQEQAYSSTEYLDGTGDTFKMKKISKRGYQLGVQ